MFVFSNLSSKASSHVPARKARSERHAAHPDPAQRGEDRGGQVAGRGVVKTRAHSRASPTSWLTVRPKMMTSLLIHIRVVPLLLLTACHLCEVKQIRTDEPIQSLVFRSTGGYADQSLSIEYRSGTASRIVLRGPSGEVAIVQPQKEALQLASQLAKIDYRSLPETVPSKSDRSAWVDSPTIDIITKGAAWSHKLTRQQRSCSHLERSFKQAMELFDQLIIMTASGDGGQASSLGTGSNR